MKKLMLMITLLGMSYVFTACTDPVAEIEDGFTIDNVAAVEGDGDEGEPAEGPLGE